MLATPLFLTEVRLSCKITSVIIVWREEREGNHGT